MKHDDLNLHFMWISSVQNCILFPALTLPLRIRITDKREDKRERVISGRPRRPSRKWTGQRRAHNFVPSRVRGGRRRGRRARRYWRRPFSENKFQAVSFIFSFLTFFWGGRGVKAIMFWYMFFKGIIFLSSDCYLFIYLFIFLHRPLKS